MSSTLEEKTHRTADRGRDIRTAWGWIARPVEVPGGLFHDGCGLVAISSNRETYEARGMAACGIDFESSDHLPKVCKKNIFSGGVRGELCPKAKNCVSILPLARWKSSIIFKCRLADLRRESNEVTSSRDREQPERKRRRSKDGRRSSGLACRKLLGHGKLDRVLFRIVEGLGQQLALGCQPLIISFQLCNLTAKL